MAKIEGVAPCGFSRHALPVRAIDMRRAGGYNAMSDLDAFVDSLRDTRMIRIVWPVRLFTLVRRTVQARKNASTSTINDPSEIVNVLRRVDQRSR